MLHDELTEYSPDDNLRDLDVLRVFSTDISRRGALGERQQRGGGEAGHAAHTGPEADGRHGWGAKRLECNLRETL